jgi:hypothetical protein
MRVNFGRVLALNEPPAVAASAASLAPAAARFAILVAAPAAAAAAAFEAFIVITSRCAEKLEAPTISAAASTLPPSAAAAAEGEAAAASASAPGPAPPRSRDIDNKHSTDIGVYLTSTVNAHTDAWSIRRRRRRRFNVGGVHLLNNPLPAAPGRGGVAVGEKIVAPSPWARSPPPDMNRRHIGAGTSCQGRPLLHF